MATTSNSGLTRKKADHNKVTELLAQFEEATTRRQQDVAQTTIQELEIHAG